MKIDQLKIMIKPKATKPDGEFNSRFISELVHASSVFLKSGDELHVTVNTADLAAMARTFTVLEVYSLDIDVIGVYNAE